jgi:hypothetical protein
MPLRIAITDALHAQDDVHALACVDLERGVVLAAAARDEESPRDAVEIAAQVAAQLSVAPRVAHAAHAAHDTHDDALAREGLAVSDRVIHAFARVSARPEWAVVAVARGGANVALVIASVRSLARTVAGASS